MNIIDIIILAILGLSLVSGMYKGFLASTLALIGFVGSWFGALNSYRYVADVVSSSPIVTTALSSVLSEVSLIKTPALAQAAVNAVSGSDIAQAASEIGVPIIKEMFQNNVAGQAFASLGIGTLSEYLTQTLVVALIDVVAFVVALAVIYMAALLLVNLLNHVFRFPQLRHLDWLLGGAFGVVRGLIVVLLVFAVLPMALDALEGMDLPLVGDLIAQSNLAGFFINNNILVGLLQKMLV
ncbi:MAG: hypothetical protein GX558_05290 [Clostridiales bacterium]|nr:hypothetical protein [Clostridiales bacterium]